MIAERLTAQLLAGPLAADPVAVVDRLLAVQAQDRRGFRLAIRSRMQGGTVADVDRVLTEDRSLVVSWLNRGTLHLVRSEDYPWLQALTTPQRLAATVQRLAQEGVDAAAAGRAVELLVSALAAEGPLTRKALGERLAVAGKPASAAVFLQLVALLSYRGLAVRGPVVGSEQAYVLVRDWIGAPKPVDRDRALAELAYRYLLGHGPADDRDLARWAGIGLRDARRGLEAIAPRLVEQQNGLVDLAGRTPAANAPPRLLGAFDPMLLGWASREFLPGADKVVLTANGIFRAFALVGGRAVAVWRLEGGKVVIDPFVAIRRTDAKALTAEAADVIRYLGL